MSVPSQGISMPTHFRHLSDTEWAIVDPVFGATLPMRVRVFLGDGLGAEGRPFTVPTSVISSSLIALGIANPFASLAGPAGWVTAPLRTAKAIAVGRLASVVNAGFVINVGRDYYFRGLTVDDYGKALLVHEMTHVWQGKNDTLALNATLGSLAAQCKGVATTRSMAGSGLAYDYTMTPTPVWGNLNPEQQAQIVEHWYTGFDPATRTWGAATDTGNPRFSYIRDYVRAGKVK